MNLEVGYIERFIKGLVTNYFDGSYTLFLLVAFVCFAIISVSIYLLVANHFAKKNNMSLWKYIRKMESDSKVKYNDFTNIDSISEAHTYNTDINNNHTDAKGRYNSIPNSPFFNPFYDKKF